MPYVKRFVQVIAGPTTPNQTQVFTHNLGNTDIQAVQINSDDPAVPVIPFTWAVVDEDRVSVLSSLNLDGCWIVVKAA